MFGDAAMLSAQFEGALRSPMGMKLPAAENARFLLYLMRWLARLE
jgi:hypothetical protein